MAWFTETAWPPIFICLAAAALALLAWGNGQRRKMLLVAIVFVLACPILFAFEKYHVTEPEKVEQQVHELVSAVESDDVEEVLSFFSEESRGLRFAVKNGMSQVRVEGGVRITDLQVRYGDDKSEINSHFRANGEAARKTGSARGRFTTRWEVTWKQSNGRWRITSLKRLDPIDGKVIDLMAPPE